MALIKYLLTKCLHCRSRRQRFYKRHVRMISFLRLLVGLQIYLQIVCSQKKTKTKQYQKLHFFFYKNIFYKNMEAEICKILRIW